VWSNLIIKIRQSAGDERLTVAVKATEIFIGFFARNRLTRLGGFFAYWAIDF
jgi:hypothetical protein